MDCLNINNLPPEVLTKVFRFLDEKNLKEATLTRELWKNLIQSTCRWSLKLNYDEHGKFESKFPNSAEQKMHFILTTNRKFGKIEIANIRLSEDQENHQIYQIFKRHGFNVVELTLIYCRFNNLVNFCQFLNLIPNLTSAKIFALNLQNAASDVPLEKVLLLPNLEKLKILDIGDSDQRTIECFRKAKLTAMKIRLPLNNGGHGQGYFGSENRNSVNFLLSQNMLTSLTVDSEASSILIELGKLSHLIPFRLTRLESSMKYGASSDDHDNFLRFIQTQAESLTEMKMGRHIPNSVYECVFASMPKLNTLDVAADGIPQDSDFYKQSKENCNIRTIKLCGHVFNARYVVDFLKKLPNNRHLILSFSLNAEVAQNVNQLESLSIGHFQEHSIQSVTLPNLKALNICFMLGKIDWNEFTKAHPLLAELTIWRMGNKSYLTSDDIEHITTNVDLQHMGLGFGFVADDRFFRIVRSKCTNLKTLELDKSCLPHGLDYNAGISVLRLRSFWTQWFE